MKVLIVSDNVKANNLFVATLCDSIRSYGVDVHCSIADFWNATEKYDIIHFQWPDEVVGWNCKDETMIERLKTRVDELRSKGSRFIYTRHNIQPHNGNKTTAKAYQIIEACSDLIVHMGKYSLNEFLRDYPHSNNIIIPHHIYQYTYNEFITQHDARRRLDIPDNSFVITTFGQFRNWGEISLVLQAFFRLKLKNKFLLAPRMFPVPYYNRCRNLINTLGLSVLITTFRKWAKMYVGASSTLISNDDLPLFLISCDVVLIQRKNILNSGNVPLAFMFGKTVIGPKVGNVQELLEETGNITFDANKTSSITDAIERAYILSRSQHGEKNYNYATQHFNIQRIGSLYVDAYHRVVQ